MKIIKKLAYFLIALLALWGLITIVAYVNKEKIEKTTNELQQAKNELSDKKYVALIKSLSLSIMLYQNSYNKLPVKLIDLEDAGQYGNDVSLGVVKYANQSDQYLLCAPYSALSTVEVSNQNQTWFIQNGQICLAQR